MTEPEILYEDASLVVINKPFGVVVNTSDSTPFDTIQYWFVNKYSLPTGESEFLQKGGVVHRLDRDTSGVMVLAKTESAYNYLKLQFLERRVEKKYWALVHGTFRDPQGTISAPIERHPKDRHKFTIGTDLSRTAITDWEVKTSYKDFSLVEMTPHTGRTHQLRVHLQSLHHPIVSDPIYGFKKQHAEDLHISPRLFLHAYSLTFVHPDSHEKVHFESSLPPQLAQVLESLVH